jgi:hypothetical protein
MGEVDEGSRILMEPFDENKVISELIDLAQTPDQVAWLKTVVPGVTQDKIKGLQDLAVLAEADSERWRAELRRVNNQLESSFTPKQVELIIRAMLNNLTTTQSEYY